MGDDVRGDAPGPLGEEARQGVGDAGPAGEAGAGDDGPFAEAKEIIGGLFVVDARDYDEAVSVAKGCPHLDFGTIEVREIEPMP